MLFPDTIYVHTQYIINYLLVDVIFFMLFIRKCHKREVYSTFHFLGNQSAVECRYETP